MELDVVIDPDTRIVSITPTDGSREGGSIRFTATTTRQTASDSLDIHIANVTPVIDVPDLFLDAGESAQLLLDDFATDDDVISLLTWSATPLAAGVTASLNQAVRALTLTADEGVTGDLTVAFSATDEQGAAGLDTMLVSVRSPDEELPDSSLVDTTGTNEAPVIEPLGILSFLNGSEGRLTLDNVTADDNPVTELRWTAETDLGVTAVIDDETLDLQKMAQVGAGLALAGLPTMPLPGQASRFAKACGVRCERVRGGAPGRFGIALAVGHELSSSSSRRIGCNDGRWRCSSSRCRRSVGTGRNPG